MTPSRFLKERQELYNFKDKLGSLMQNKTSAPLPATTEEELVEEAMAEPIHEMVSNIAPKEQLTQSLSQMMKSGTEKERICAVNQSVRLIEIGVRFAIESIKQKKVIDAHVLKPRPKAKVQSNLGAKKSPSIPPSMLTVRTAPSSPASPEADVESSHDHSEEDPRPLP